MRSVAALSLALLGCASAQRRDHPRRERVVVLDVSVGGVALFAEERGALRDAVGRFLHDQHVLRLRAVDRAEVDAALALAATSRVSPAGPVCEAVPGALSIVRRRFPEALVAFTHASCDDEGCALSVSVDRPTADGALRSPPVARWRAAVTSPNDPAHWVAAVRSLAPPAPVQGGVLAVLSDNDAPTRRVVVLSVSGSGPWASQPTAERFASAQAALDGCHVRGSSFGNDDMMLSVDARGAVARCEVPTDNPATDGARARCLCDAVRGLDFGAGEAGRRVSAAVMNEPESGVQSGDRCVRGAIDAAVSDDRAVTAAGFGDLSEGVARCAAALTLTAPLRVNASITVSATGRVTDASVPDASLDPVFRACLVDALRAARTTCATSSEGASVRLRLRAWSATERCANFTP